MNSARDLLAELQSMGVELQANGNKIKVRAPVGKVTTALRDRLAAAKPELLRLLSPRPQVWHFLVDGKGVTAIDPERLPRNEFAAFLERKFGPSRVTQLTNHLEKKQS